MGRIYHNKFFAMGTRFHAIMPGMADDDADRIFRMIKCEVERIETRLSRFLPDSDVSRLNRLAHKNQQVINDELFDVFKACKYCWQLTGGAFDLTLRPMMDYWKKKDTSTDVDDEFFRLKENLGMEHVVLNEENQTVYFDNEIIEMDFGGFGKGYALEKVKGLLSDLSVKDAFISFGESSVLAIGNHPAGDAWKIGINDYLNPGKSVHRFIVSDGSVSTSGNFFVADDGTLRTHRHIINPANHKPAGQFASVSVAAESPVLSEMLSTAFLLSDDETIRNVLDQYEDVEVIQTNYETGEARVNKFEKLNV